MQTQFLVRKPEGRRPLGRPRRKWEYNIKTSILEIAFYRIGTGGTFPGGKAAGAWSRPLTSNQCRG